MDGEFSLSRQNSCSQSLLPIQFYLLAIDEMEWVGMERFANLFMWAALLLGVAYMYAKPGIIIQKATRSLASKELTEERVTLYLNTLKVTKRVPNYKKYRNACKEGYDLISASQVSPELKDQVRQTMLTMGVTGI
jgi:hypothetical protein